MIFYLKTEKNSDLLCVCFFNELRQAFVKICIYDILTVVNFPSEILLLKTGKNSDILLFISLV